ncbi:hypothetical protein G5V59_02745 [Nocardioides sp. W3-2-3]|uniref:hypothetical protein n=1 Tax=Nocardioides convexus TaxID=2712224 RepID=UPI0024184EF9|nr:hypothetical protein [Nocardioides convexus]NGZ99669.1 hypothetical protein [Nocardioides convexus]
MPEQTDWSGPLLLDGPDVPVVEGRPMDHKKQPKKAGNGTIPARQSNGFYADHVTGDRLRSVTTILGGGVPKPALMFWSAKTCTDCAIEHLPALVAASRHPEQARRAPVVDPAGAHPEEGGAGRGRVAGPQGHRVPSPRHPAAADHRGRRGHVGGRRAGARAVRRALPGVRARMGAAVDGVGDGRRERGRRVGRDAGLHDRRGRAHW